MPDNFYTASAKRKRLARAMEGPEREYHLSVFVCGAMIFDEITRDFGRAREIWERYRDADCWPECRIDGKRLKWIEADRLFTGYAYKL